MEPEDGLEQVREPLERDVLIGAEVRGERHDVGAEGYRGAHVLGEPALAAVAAGALHPHLEMPRHRRHDRKRDVHHLPRGGDCRGFHVRRFAAHGTDGRGIPVLRTGHIPGLRTRAALMPPLPAGLPAGGLPLGLRVRNAYRVLGGRDTAVGAGLRNGFGSALKYFLNELDIEQMFMLFNLLLIIFTFYYLSWHSAYYTIRRTTFGNYSPCSYN